MNTKALILPILFLVPVALPAKDWFRGFVLLKDDRLLRGEIDVRSDCNAILFRYGEAEMVYPAHKILYLSFYDDDVDERRTFVSLRQDDGASNLHELYEVIVDGDIGVLRKELSSWKAYHLETEDFEYFVIMNGELYEMKAFRRDLYPQLLDEFSSEIKALRRSRHTGYDNLPRIVRVISLINEAAKMKLQAKADRS